MSGGLVTTNLDKNAQGTLGLRLPGRNRSAGVSAGGFPNCIADRRRTESSQVVQASMGWSGSGDYRAGAVKSVKECRLHRNPSVRIGASRGS